MIGHQQNVVFNSLILCHTQAFIYVTAIKQRIYFLTHPCTLDRSIEKFKLARMFLFSQICRFPPLAPVWILSELVALGK